MFPPDFNNLQSDRYIAPISDAQRFLELGWQILEHKCRYYILLNQVVSDFEYDQLEREYDSLADKLGLPKSASDMVDFDLNRPSCKRVHEKLTTPQVKRSRKLKVVV